MLVVIPWKKIIKNCREVKKCNDGINRMKKEDQRENFRYLFWFKEHDTKTTLETTLESLRDTLEGENIQTHCKVLGYQTDLYFHDYKLAVEIDEKDHQDRDISREIERQRALEKKLGCKFIRINPDKKNNIFKAQNEIFSHIKESKCLKTSKCLKHVV